MTTTRMTFGRALEELASRYDEVTFTETPQTWLCVCRRNLHRGGGMRVILRGPGDNALAAAKGVLERTLAIERAGGKPQ